MKIAKALIIGVYVHLTLYICSPFFLNFVVEREFDIFGYLWIGVYLIVCLCVMVVGWAAVGGAVVASHRERYDDLRRGWKLLKLGSVPFFAANAVCCFMWSLIAIVMPPAMLLFLILPALFASQLIIQSGCVGAVYIKHLRSVHIEKKRAAFTIFSKSFRSWM